MRLIGWLLVAVIVACLVATFVRADELKGYRPLRCGEKLAADLFEPYPTKDVTLLLVSKAVNYSGGEKASLKVRIASL